MRVKGLAMGTGYGKTLPCCQKNCALCEMIADQEQYTINGKKVRPVSGTCSTYNLIYYIVSFVRWAINHPLAELYKN